MESKRKQLGKPMCRRLSVLLICTLILGMLPMPEAPVCAVGCQATAEADAKAGQTTLSNPTTDADGVTTWDTIYFGSYWQNDTNGDGEANQNDEKEPIRWRVLSVDGDDAFLLADQNLDCQPYNKDTWGVTWETCTLRIWLNDTFLNNAFTAVEQSAIRETVVENSDNPEYGTEGGNNTTDKVYLLSIDEVTNPEYGFPSDSSICRKSRRAKNTEYAKRRGVIEPVGSGQYAGIGCWWLRSPGNYSYFASNVYCNGSVERFGYYVIDGAYAARPALHLNLSSTSSWSYAGTVNSKGTYKQPSSPAPAATRKPVESGMPGTLNNPTTDAESVITWDTIYFGSYWQNDTNGDGKADQEDEKEPIRWRVLSLDGDDAFLLAEQNLDCQPYNNEPWADVTWETCTLRNWLNYTFLNNAFTTAEQSEIRETVVENLDNPEYGSEGGNDTTDKVYLLSIDEVTKPEYGFSSNYSKHRKSIMAKNTEYAKTQGAYANTYGEYAANGDWWLRSSGSSSHNASYVDSIGYVIRNGSGVSSSKYAVRPALHLNLSSTSGWSYAGTVNSEGIGEQPSSQAPAATRKPVESGVPGALNNPTTDADGVTTWDTIYFGSYWQNDTNGDGKADREDEKEPIRWRVLSVNGDDAFLLADQNLCCISYNVTRADVTWKGCMLRRYLNYDSFFNFLNDAFTTAEQSAIRETVVENPDNPDYETEAGNDTIDKVYLLSIDEVTNPKYGFSSDYDEYDKSRRAKNTEYAKEQGAYTDTDEEYAENGVWWLRSPGYNFDYASFVGRRGSVDQYGGFVDNDILAVRPALHLNLSSDSGWLYAGTINSEGTEGQPSSPSPTATAKPASTPTIIATASPATTTKPSAKPTDQGTKPTENPGTNPDATPGITEQPSAKPTGKPDITPGVTEEPSTKPTENLGTNPDETPGIPTIKPNDNTQLQPSGSVPNQSGGVQQSDSSKAEGNKGSKQDTSLSQPKAGTVLTISGTQYKVQSTSGKKKTVVFLKAASKKLKKATIPNTIKYKSETYEVVEISKNAFKGCKSLTKVTIGSKVKVIGSGAFSGCKKLKTVTIRSKVLKKIGTGAFAGVNPKAKLKAPKSKISQYRKLMKKAGWRE